MSTKKNNPKMFSEKSAKEIFTRWASHHGFPGLARQPYSAFKKERRWEFKFDMPVFGVFSFGTDRSGKVIDRDGFLHQWKLVQLSGPAKTKAGGK